MSVDTKFLYKKFSFGIDHNRDIKWDKYFLDKYKDYLLGIYLSVPDNYVGPITSSRVDNFTSTFNQKYYEEIIDYARGLGLKINFTINNAGWLFDKTIQNEVPKILNILEEKINFYTPEEICTLDKLVDYLKPQASDNIDWVRSFIERNVPLDLTELATKYSTFILRPNTFYKYLLNNINLSTIKYRIMPNMCCPGCTATKCPSCEKVYQTEVLPNLEQYLATHTFTEIDFKLCNKIFRSFDITYKLASRVDNYNRFDMILESYIGYEYDIAALANIACEQIFDYYYIAKDGPLFKRMTLDSKKFIANKLVWWSLIKKYAKIQYEK